MKLLFLLFLTLMVGCSKLKPSAESKNTPDLTLDDNLAGFWKLLTPNAVNSNGVVAPRIIKLQINANGYRQADTCDIGGHKNQSSSAYDLNGDLFEITYYDFNESTAPKPTDLPFLEEKKFIAKLTKLNSDFFELNGNIVYERFVPELDSALSDNAANLCN